MTMCSVACFAFWRRCVCWQKQRQAQCDLRQARSSAAVNFASITCTRVDSLKKRCANSGLIAVHRMIYDYPYGRRYLLSYGVYYSLPWPGTVMLLFDSWHTWRKEKETRRGHQECK